MWSKEQKKKGRNAVKQHAFQVPEFKEQLQRKSLNITNDKNAFF